MTTDEKVARFVSLTETKRDLEAKLNPIEKEIKELKPQISEEFNAIGQKSVNRNGWVVYLSRQLSVRAVDGDTDAVVDKLRRARLGELISISHPKLSAYVKEKMYNPSTDTWELDLGKLPPSLREVVEVSEYYNVNCKKS